MRRSRRPGEYLDSRRRERFVGRRRRRLPVLLDHRLHQGDDQAGYQRHQVALLSASGWSGGSAWRSTDRPATDGAGSGRGAPCALPGRCAPRSERRSLVVCTGRPFGAEQFDDDRGASRVPPSASRPVRTAPAASPPSSTRPSAWYSSGIRRPLGTGESSRRLAARCDRDRSTAAPPGGRWRPGDPRQPRRRRRSPGDRSRQARQPRPGEQLRRAGIRAARQPFGGEQLRHAPRHPGPSARSASAIAP